MNWRMMQGDALERLRELEAGGVQTCVTSPPYFRLRDFGAGDDSREIGREELPADYVWRLVERFAEVQRVLRDDGTAWLNLGDSYINGQLTGVPWLVAHTLQSEGWWLRSAVVWHRPNVIPDPAQDRPGQHHEMVFLLTKRRRYFYNADAVREQSDPAQEEHNRRYAREYQAHTDKAHKGQPGNVNHKGIHGRPGPGGRGLRDVWTIPTTPSPRDHPAVMPRALARRCVLATSRPGDLVLDPFCGSGTTGLEALRHDRSFVGIELNPEYVEMARRRICDDAPLLNTGLEVAA